MSASESSPDPSRGGLVGGRWSRVAYALLLALVACCFFIALMQILLGLVTLAWAVDRWRVRRPAPPLPLLLFFAGYLAVSVVSALRSSGPVAAVDVLGEAMPPILFFVALDLCSERRRLGRALWVVVLSSTLAAVLGLVQAVASDSGFRIAGTLSHYMTYSGLLMMSLAVALALWVRAVGRTRVLLSVALLLMVAALLQTQTRGAWLGAGAAGLIVLWSWRPRALLLLPVVAVLAYALAPAPVQQRIRSVADLGDRTASERVYMWRAGRAMIAEHPWLGVGPEEIRARYGEFRLPDDPRTEATAPGHLHDNVVNIAAERGLLGLAAWLAIWVGCFWSYGRIRRATAPGDELARTAVLGCFAAMVAFQVMGVFEFNYGDSEVVSLCLFLMALPFAAARAAGAGQDGAGRPGWSGPAPMTRSPEAT